MIYDELRLRRGTRRLEADQAKERQASSSVLLVRPAAFGFNPETAATNVFASAEHSDLRQEVLREFDSVAKRLEDSGVEVVVLEDAPEPIRPDAIFPNNWMSFHADGTMVLYPMEARSRQLERQPDLVRDLLALRGFDVRRCIDLSQHEQAARYLEGTGSLILDRPRRRAFASLSPRTHPEVIAEFDAQLGYSTFVFGAQDWAGRSIYHTNVLMSLGTRFAVLCLEAAARHDRGRLIDEVDASGRSIIEVDFEQLKRFACNIIELENVRGDPLIAISSAAKASLRQDQIRTLESFGDLLDVDIPTIERVGGGSVRCMIADIHLPRVSQAT